MSGDTSSARAEASSGSSGTKPEVKGGQPIRDGKFEFIVTKVERDVPSIGGEYANKKAQGS